MKSDPSVTQKYWTDEFNSILKSEYGLNQDLKSVFIDTFYYQESQHEIEAFHNQTQILLNFALSRDPFELNPISHGGFEHS